MSSKTIANFESYRRAHGADRAAPTQPPPAGLAGDLEAQAAKCRREGHALLARAEELEAAARAQRRIERANGL